MENTAKKYTKKEMYGQLIAFLNGQEVEISIQELVEFCEKAQEQLNKKSGADAKPSARQVENETIKDKIYEFLVSAEGQHTVAEIMEGCEAVKGMSNQRVSALLTQLKNEGRIVNTKEKKVSYYSAVVEQ